MKKAFRNILSISAVSVLSAVFLASCGPTDADARSIKINKDSFEDFVFNVGENVSYNNLAIDLLDANDKVISTKKYKDNKDTIKYSAIDTSKVANNLEFTVTYTPSEGKEFKATEKYSVVENGGSDIEITSWERCKAYTDYLNSVEGAIKVSTDLSTITDDNASFISEKGKFYIATHNPVSIKPKTKGIDEEGNVGDVDGLPSDTVVTILNRNNEELEISDYLSSDALLEARTKGIFDFEDNLEGKETDVIIKFSSESLESKDISYDVTLVDGWNITEAKQLVLVDNVNTSSSYIELKKEILNDNNATEKTSFENFVIFNNISLGFDDLPSDLIWDSKRDGNQTKYDGSLKDWKFMFNHNVGDKYNNTDSDGLYIYGNYNKIELDETFPWVKTEDRDGITDSKDLKIDTHTTLFGNQQNHVDNLDYTFNYVDLASTGNQGVAPDQVIDDNGTPDNPDDDIVGGGILFSKSAKTTNYNNCVINKYFTININQGTASTDENDHDDVFMTKTNIVNSKLFDCFSSMMFNWAEGGTYTTNSILRNAGGPLFINQAVDFGTSAYDSFPDAKKKGSHVEIDSKSVVNNFVTGQGGWFDLYGATPAVSVLKTLSDGLLVPKNKTMFKTVNGNESFNCIAASMVINVESAGTLDPGAIATVKIGNKIYIDYTDKESEFTSSIASAQQNNLQPLMNLLTNSHWGGQFLFNFASTITGYETVKNLPLFVTYNKDNNPYLFSVAADTYGNFTGLTDLMYYLNLFMNPTEAKAGIEDGFADGSEYMGTYVQLGMATKSSRSLETTRATDPTQLIQQMVAYYNNYKGSTSYGLVCGIYDK